VATHTLETREIAVPHLRPIVAFVNAPCRAMLRRWLLGTNPHEREDADSYIGRNTGLWYIDRA
jgi:hypothetical protein